MRRPGRERELAQPGQAQAQVRARVLPGQALVRQVVQQRVAAPPARVRGLEQQRDGHRPP
jgi:hypothetical protein